MKRWLAAITIALAVLAWHAEVQAQCTTNTITVNGVMHICTTCCYPSGCNTFCS